MTVLENELLCHHTTLRTGGFARYFLETTTEPEIVQAVQFARHRGLPVYVLGDGSNVLAVDAGFDGAVIRISTKGIQTSEMSAPEVEVIAEAGETWDALVSFAVDHGLFGLENMSLIPGTVGAAIVGNIGAYGTEIKDVLRWAECLDLRTGQARRLSRDECRMGYRQSYFKRLEGRNLIVTRAGFFLRRNGSLHTEYKDLADYFTTRGEKSPGLAEVREAVICIRRRKLPDLSRVGTAGSFFKNPTLTRAEYEALNRRYPGLPGHDEQNGLVKVPLGWILDKICGLKGVRQGRVGTHPEQALVITNEGGTAAEVEAFANDIARLARERTGLDLEWEVEKMGPRGK